MGTNTSHERLPVEHRRTKTVDRMRVACSCGAYVESGWPSPENTERIAAKMRARLDGMHREKAR